jgi:hypothetical protein
MTNSRKVVWQGAVMHHLCDGIKLSQVKGVSKKVLKVGAERISANTT